MNDIFREENKAPLWMTLALVGPGLLAAAVVLIGAYRDHLPWWVLLVGIIPAGIGYVLWRQFRVLLVQVDPEAIRFGFGSFTKIISRSTIVHARPMRVRLWNTGGLGIRRGWGWEGWIATFGDGVELTLQNKKRFLFSAKNPVALCTLLEKPKT